MGTVIRWTNWTGWQIGVMRALVSTCSCLCRKEENKDKEGGGDVMHHFTMCSLKFTFGEMSNPRRSNLVEGLVKDVSPI